MGRPKNKHLLLFLLLVASIPSLTLPQTAYASVPIIMTAPADPSMHIPPTPDFTVRFVDNSFDVPPTYAIDQNTGKNITIADGYHVQYETISIQIKNPDLNPSPLYLYHMRMKDHSDSSWIYPDCWYFQGTGYIIANNSDYTVMTFGLVGNNFTSGFPSLNLTMGSQEDFQVQSFNGSITTVTDGYTASGDELLHHVFAGKTSDWSQTQTIMIPTPSSLTPSSSPTSSPKPAMNLATFAVLLLLIVTLSVVIFAVLIKKFKTAPMSKEHKKDR